jgi:cytochrome b6
MAKYPHGRPTATMDTSLTGRGKATRMQLFWLRTFAWLEDRFLLRQFRIQSQEFIYRINMQMPVSHTERYNLRVIWYWYPLYTLGSLSLLSFLIATISGVLLALYYVPSTAMAPLEPYGDLPTEAWVSVAVTISQEIPFGFMLRQMHFWSAMVMVAAVVLHTCRIYFTQSYKKPREVNYFVGVLLLVLTLGLGYTGYLLPWSQLSYWAGQIGLQMALITPGIGEWAAALVFGGASLGQATITRMYVLHVFILPIITFLVMVLHILLVWVQGITEPH